MWVATTSADDADSPMPAAAARPSPPADAPDDDDSDIEIIDEIILSPTRMPSRAVKSVVNPSEQSRGDDDDDDDTATNNSIASSDAPDTTASVKAEDDEKMSVDDEKISVDDDESIGDDDSNDDDWPINDILDYCFILDYTADDMYKNAKLQYLVKWEGFGNFRCRWVPKEDLSPSCAPRLTKKFQADIEREIASGIPHIPRYPKVMFAEVAEDIKHSAYYQGDKTFVPKLPQGYEDHWDEGWAQDAANVARRPTQKRAAAKRRRN